MRALMLYSGKTCVHTVAGQEDDSINNMEALNAILDGARVGREMWG